MGQTYSSSTKPKRRGSVTLVLGLVVTGMLVSACASPERVPAVPEARTVDAKVPEIPNARFYWDSKPASVTNMAKLSFEREVAFRQSQNLSPFAPNVEALAISGGGDNGAFGAGLLLGWTETGNRPEFKLVTGISTGALTAPFAYLGPDYDEKLKEVYTTISADDIYEERGLTAAIFDDALSDTMPLRELVARYADQELMDAVAKEYQKGRILLIGTTNLDARRPVVWNMGAIAESGAPGALQLFRDVLVASASIPGAFPPVMFEVELDGRRYQEMHVDGGAMTQVFVYPPSYHPDEKVKQVRDKRSLYIIRNARLDPDWASVERQTLDIVERALTSLIHTQGLGDLYQMYLISQRDEIDFNLAFIPSDFSYDKAEEFEPGYMKALFTRAYDAAREGYAWHKSPPGYDDE